MKQRPINYTDEMSLAVREDRKTMTRRTISSKYIINQEPGRYKFHGFDDNDDACFEDLKPEITPWMTPIPCPYGKPRDILYVRESYYQFGYWIKDGLTKKGNQKWKFFGYDNDIRYSDNPPATYRISRDKENPVEPQWYKRLGRFMPKKYARTFLEITDIGVERAQDISWQDCIAEGVKWDHPFARPEDCSDLVRQHHWIECFRSLIESINGPEAWKKWYWVISFKVLSTTGKPAEEEMEVAK